MSRASVNTVVRQAEDKKVAVKKQVSKQPAIQDLITMKVSGSTDVKKLAGAITYNLIGSSEEHTPPRTKEIELLAVGAGSINQMIKAIIIAKGFIASSARSLKFDAGFTDLTFGEESKTGIKFVLSI